MKRNNIENHLKRMSQIVGISREEATSAIRTRRHTIIAFLISVIGAFIFIVGPMPGKYGGISIQDFNWPWLF